MKIIVCVKQVPDTSGRVSVKEDGTLDRASMPVITNHDDKTAIEAALRLKDRYGCRVVVVTMGPGAAESMLRDLLAMGYKPSPQIGKWLDACFEAQLDGAFSDHAGALAWFKENLQK